MTEFKSINNAKYVCENGKIVMHATPKSDYFVNPENDDVIGNAPFLYREVTGDFTAVAKVSHGFVSTYDACVLLAYDNERKWAKACFEFTDIGTKAVVTVMTNGRSDDANSVNVDDEYVWLKLSRKNDVFAVHYSFGGEKYMMARITNIPMNKTIKVGMVAQSPCGEGGDRIFEHFEIKQITLNNIRAGK